MKWPFGKKKVPEPAAQQVAEPSAMDRLLSKNCSKDEFALLYLKLMEETKPAWKFEMTGDMQIRFVNEEGKEATTYLHNVWVAYSQNPDDRRATLERYLTVVPKLAEASPQPARDSVVAQIKDAGFFAGISNYEFVTDHLCGDLWIVYAQDLPDRMLTMKASHLSELGLEKSELLHLAVENLSRILPNAERHGDGPWYWLTAGGDYDASLLLIDTIWEQLADSVDGEIVAVVPARHTLLFTGSQSEEGLKAIKQQATETVTAGSYLISETLIVRRGGRWEVYNAN
jgi:uncharacterized protein YtpQ (UPF0354 family)